MQKVVTLRVGRSGGRHQQKGCCENDGPSEYRADDCRDVHLGNPLVGIADDKSDGAVIGTMLRAKTPGHAGILGREIQRLFAFGTMAIATVASCLAAAIIVGNKVVLIVDRVATGANPRNC